MSLIWGHASKARLHLLWESRLILSVALAQSAHPLRVQLGVYGVSACWSSALCWGPPSRYPASVATPLNSTINETTYSLQEEVEVGTDL